MKGNVHSQGYVWTIAEQFEGKLKTVSFELLSRGRDLADKLKVPLCSILIGPILDEEKLNMLIHRGADEVIVVEDIELRYFNAEMYSAILTALINDYQPEIILAAATSTGRTLMP
jgi:electron transfer flavoprotein alpha subunit